MTEQEIAKKYDVTLYAISDINRGKSWHDDSISYPIRKQDVEECSYETFLDVIKLLQTNLFSSQWICQQFGLQTSTLLHINTGKYKKFSYPNNITFPIQKFKNVTNNTKISTRDKICLLIDKIQNANVTIGQLANKYHISQSYVKALIRNQNHPHFFDDIIFPLSKENSEYNLHMLYNKLSILNKYGA